MKQLIIGLLFVASNFAQVPDTILLERFAWPDPVAQAMAKVVPGSGEVNTFTRNELMFQGYDTKHNRFGENLTISEGMSVEVWRSDYKDTRYFLVASGTSWYWTTLPLKKEVRQRFKIQKDPMRVKFQFSYWNANHGEKIAGSRVSGYVDKRFYTSQGFGNFTLSPGIGLSIRYKPSEYDRSLNEMIPMYQLRLGVDWAYQSLKWHTSGNYYRPFQNHFDTWEIYNKLSWKLPLSLNKFRLNFVYYGSQPSDQSWVYSEAKVQFLYTYKKWWIGIEPYVVSRWANNEDWVTQSRSKPGNFVVGSWADDYWLELSYGTYHKQSGLIPYISQENDEKHLSLTIGTNLLRR